MADEPKVIASGAQEGAVVADEHDGAFKLIERHSQRFARGQVQMVGRLIQQQQIGFLPDDEGEHKARFFAAAHAAHGLGDHVASE